MPGGQKFSIKLSPLSVRFPQRRPLNLIEKTPIYKLPQGAIYKPPCVQLINNPFFAIHQVFALLLKSQGHPFPEIFGGFWCLVSAVGFFGGFFRGFFGPFSSGKQAEKNPPKNPPKNPRLSRQLFDQNPLREISALIKSGIPGPNRAQIRSQSGPNQVRWEGV